MKLDESCGEWSSLFNGRGGDAGQSLGLRDPRHEMREKVLQRLTIIIDPGLLGYHGEKKLGAKCNVLYKNLPWWLRR